MKVCIIQPEYSADYNRSEELFEKQLALMAQCDDTMDIIVMPESADIPCLARTEEEGLLSVEKFNERLLCAASETAKRCNAILFVNARSRHETKLRNTTYAFDRSGKIVGMYHKQHLTPGEVRNTTLDSDYSFEYSQPTVIEIEGIRFGFLVCYDFYFYEAWSNLARQKLDVIIGCSHQRSDTHRYLTFSSQFLAYNTNAYVLRSSVSMDENSNIGGGSVIVAPDGEVLASMESRIGLATAEIDIAKKYYKPAGFGNPPAAHYEYIEQGRRPMKYRPGGSAIVPTDAQMAYPRVCAHRGFNAVAPENSMPAYGAAIAMGAEEIEFDLWPTKDGEIISCHDLNLERLTGKPGFVLDLTLEELRKYDFGGKFSEKFKGMPIMTFEDILKKFSCQTIMNIHIKTYGFDAPVDRSFLQKIIDLVHQFDCEKHVYFMCGHDGVLEALQEMAPDIARCCGAGDDPWGIVERAIRYGCKKVQLFKPYFNQEMIDKAHANGIICNVFWSDDPEEAKQFLNMGIDTILTNDYNLVAQAVKNP